MKLFRQQQRAERGETQSWPQPNDGTLPGEGDVAVIGCESDSGAIQRQHMQPTQDLCSTAFAAIMEQGFESTSLPPTHRRMVEYDIRPLNEYTRKPVANFQACIDHCEYLQMVAAIYPKSKQCVSDREKTYAVIKYIWPVLLPAPSSTEISPLAMDWFSMMRTSSPLFHASISFAGPHIDWLGKTQFFRSNPEIIGHRVEAIRQINQALSGNDISEATLLAILNLTDVPQETDLQRQMRADLDAASPFKPPSMPNHWQENFTATSLDDAHLQGSRKIVTLKGGIHMIKSPVLVKVLTQ
jgi:hypothetical protein